MITSLRSQRLHVLAAIALLLAIGLAALPGAARADLPPALPSSYPSEDCASDPVVRGFVGDTFVNLQAEPTADGALTLCVAGEAGGTHVGGKLVVGGGSVPTPADGNVAACAADPANVVLRHGTLGPDNEPYRLEVTPRTAEVWVCVRLTSSFGTRFVVPTTNPTATSFAADSPLPSGYGERDPMAGNPSSACQNAPTGRTRLVNLASGSTHTWLYVWQEAARTNVCVRSSAHGGRLMIQSPLALVATSSTDMSPCTSNVITDGGPPPFSIRTSVPGATTPVSVCVEVEGMKQRLSFGGQGAPIVWVPDDPSLDPLG